MKEVGSDKFFSVLLSSDCAFVHMATFDRDLNNSLTQCRSSGESSTTMSNKENSKLLLEREIGYLKNNVFRSMTNFSMRCMGYVVDNVVRFVAKRFLFSVIPKDHIQTEIEGDESDSRGVSFLG